MCRSVLTEWARETESNSVNHTRTTGRDIHSPTSTHMPGRTVFVSHVARVSNTRIQRKEHNESSRNCFSIFLRRCSWLPLLLLLLFYWFDKLLFDGLQVYYFMERRFSVNTFPGRMHAMHGDTFVHCVAISQSILLLEKFYGLIFIRLSETTTGEMMCDCVCVCERIEWRYLGIHNKSYGRQRQMSSTNTHFYRISILWGERVRALTLPCLLFYFILLFFLDRFFLFVYFWRKLFETAACTTLYYAWWCHWWRMNKLFMLTRNARSKKMKECRRYIVVVVRVGATTDDNVEGRRGMVARKINTQKRRSEGKKLMMFTEEKCSSHRRIVKIRTNILAATCIAEKLIRRRK